MGAPVAGHFIAGLHAQPGSGCGLGVQPVCNHLLDHVQPVRAAGNLRTPQDPDWSLLARRQSAAQQSIQILPEGRWMHCLMFQGPMALYIVDMLKAGEYTVA